MVKRLEYYQRYFVLNEELHREPVELLEYRVDVVDRGFLFIMQADEFCTS